jgi:hypothetical protein
MYAGLKFRSCNQKIKTSKEVFGYEADVSAEGKTEKKGTWFPKKNEDKER